MKGGPKWASQYYITLAVVARRKIFSVGIIISQSDQLTVTILQQCSILVLKICRDGGVHGRIDWAYLM